MSAFNNYTELRDAVQKHMDRNESTIVNKIPTWIHMAEDELDRRLRHPAAEKVFKYTVQVGNNLVPAPTDLLELKMMRLSDSGTVLYQRSLETLYSLPVDSRLPVGFARRANYFVLDKNVTADTGVDFIYYMAPDKLSDSISSNLYLVAAGDILLYIALREGFSYDNNPEEAQYWGAKAEQALGFLNEQIKREAYAGSTLLYFGDIESITNYY